MGVVVLIVFVVFVGFLISSANTNTNEFVEKNKVPMSSLIPSGTYVSGHPLLDNTLKQTTLLLAENEVKIYTAWAERAVIPKSAITNVAMEDASTIQSRVGVRRLLLTGIFAFAWKKKEKVESAYFIIEWKQGNFDNETIFEFEGTGAIQKANTLRNKFINYLS